MRKALGISAMITGAIYVVIGMAASADSWQLTDKLLAGVFIVSLLGAVTLRTGK